MRARDLATPQPSVQAGAPAAEVASQLASPNVRAVFLLADGDRLRGVVSDSVLLRELLPHYVEETKAVAALVEEESVEALWRRLDGRTASDLLPEGFEEEPAVDGDATLVEVATVMVRTRSPLVAVVKDGRLVGGITIDRLLSHLLTRR